MTKEQILDMIKLLSAVESWSFANNHHMPDYLSDKLNIVVEILSVEMLK